ncbi:hypothetical protein [Oligoflexus tunisiensis]|uniref:hypothetical protein n=1 Tax=Oligoflexus tunisiensis TaxID=708132 RepID=UPI00114CA69C|nr:hypothetical protein [Oligoflexus tunisiensis]
MKLALAVMASQLMFPKGSTMEQRQALLKKFFRPPPGEMLRVTDRAIAVERRNPLLVKGELWIDPPPGQCLTVRRDPEERDHTYCKETPITWDIFELDAVGRLRFNVFIESSPETTFISWPTPYRVANYVPLGAMETGENHNIPIQKCEAVDAGTHRKIVLHTMDGRRWFIFLPEYDQPIKVAEPIPNLHVQSDVRKEENPEATETEKKPAKSVLGQLLSGEYKKERKQEFNFRVKRRHAYEMSSSGFSETGSPQGMQGKCRYRFSGAPGDPESGVIECYETDTFDTIYTHVTCFSQFKPKLKPAK